MTVHYYTQGNRDTSLALCGRGYGEPCATLQSEVNCEICLGALLTRQWEADREQVDNILQNDPHPEDVKAYDGKSLAHGERMNEYGDPKVSFQRIANFWETYLYSFGPDHVIEPEDVAKMMILLKVSRSITDNKEDTLSDIEGYVECLRMLRVSDNTGTMQESD